MGMIFVVLYKYLNCAVDKTIDLGYTASADCNTNYGIILLSNDVIYYFLVQVFENKPI